MGQPERRVRPKRRSVVDPSEFGELVDPERVQAADLEARRRRLMPLALLYIASVVVVGALAPWGVNLVLVSLFPLGIGIGVARQRWAVPPAVAGVPRLVLLATWIWCVGRALSGSWQIATIGAPLFALSIDVANAMTESRTA